MSLEHLGAHADPVRDSEIAAAAANAEAIMGDGFIAPEGESEEFTRGWQAACREFAQSAGRKALQDALAEQRGREMARRGMVLREALAARPRLAYKVLDVRMTWRGDDSGAKELSAKLTAAGKEGWRLERLVFHNLPQGEGFNDLIIAYAVMIREVK
jgi:hypothetical protein